MAHKLCDARPVRHVRGLEKLAPDELDLLELVGRRLGIRPEWLAAVISFETAGSFDPAQRNLGAVKRAKEKGVDYYGAMGLIQFMPNTCAVLLGLDSKVRANCELAMYTFSAMSFKVQMGFVEKYLASYEGRMKSLEDTYLAVFYPAAMGRPDSYVVGRKDDPGFAGRVYTQNAGFDKDKDGIVTRGEICATIRAVLPPLKDGVPVAPVPEVLNPLLFDRLALLGEDDIG